MALFGRLFFHKNHPPNQLLEIAERIYVFDCCYSTNVKDDDEYKRYMHNIVAQLQDYYPADASYMVFDFREGDGDHKRNQISYILSAYNHITVMEYPRQHENCPLLSLEMFHHFLRSSESWLSLDGGQQNVILMHCERGGWSMLAFMITGLLLYIKQCDSNNNNEERETLERMYKQAPMEVVKFLTPLDPYPSQLRYLQYVSRRKNMGSQDEWPPSNVPLVLDCIIIQMLPLYEDGKVCRPVIRVYGQDPFSKTSTTPVSRITTQIFSSLNNNKPLISSFTEVEDVFLKVDIYCHVQGDVVLECAHLCDDLVSEELVFKVMFHTSFIHSNLLMLGCDDVDCSWDTKDKFPKDFRAEVIFSDMDIIPATTDAMRVIGIDEESLEVKEIDSWKKDFDHSPNIGDINHVKDTALVGGNKKQVVDIVDADNISKVKEVTVVLDADQIEAEDEVNSSITKVSNAIRKEEHNGIDATEVDEDNYVQEDVCEDKENEKETLVYRKLEHKSPYSRSDPVGQRPDKHTQALMNKRPPSLSQKSVFDSPFAKAGKNNKKKKSALATEVKQKPVEHKWIPSNTGSFSSTSSMPIFYPPARVMKIQSTRESNGGDKLASSVHTRALSDHRNELSKGVKMLHSGSVENMSSSTTTGYQEPQQP